MHPCLLLPLRPGPDRAAPGAMSSCLFHVRDRPRRLQSTSTRYPHCRADRVQHHRKRFAARRIAWARVFTVCALRPASCCSSSSAMPCLVLGSDCSACRVFADGHRCVIRLMVKNLPDDPRPSAGEHHKEYQLDHPCSSWNNRYSRSAVFIAHRNRSTNSLIEHRRWCHEHWQ